MKGAFELAKLIASKSPVAVQGTKASMVYSRDHSVSDGLQHVVCISTIDIEKEIPNKNCSLMAAIFSTMGKKLGVNQHILYGQSKKERIWWYVYSCAVTSTSTLPMSRVLTHIASMVEKQNGRRTLSPFQYL